MYKELPARISALRAGYWITAGNDSVALRDMTTLHLKNCVKAINNSILPRSYLPYFNMELEARDYINSGRKARHDARWAEAFQDERE